MTFKRVEYQKWANFKELKTWILYNFEREYVIKMYAINLLKARGQCLLTVT